MMRYVLICFVTFITTSAGWADDDIALARITHLFGIELVKELPTSIVTKSENVRHEVTPPRPHSSFSSYFVYTTFSGRVASINAKGISVSRRACEVDAESIAIDYAAKYKISLRGPRDGNPFDATVYHKVWDADGRLTSTAVDGLQATHRILRINCRSERDEEAVRVAMPGDEVPWKTVLRLTISDSVPSFPDPSKRERDLKAL